MEYVIALFSGLSLWLLLYNYLWTKQQRSRQQAGDVILAVEQPPRSGWRKFWFVFFLVLTPTYFFSIAAFNINFLSQQKGLLYLQVIPQILLFFQFSAQSICRWLGVQLEIRENGIVRGVTFWPWDKIKYCRWAVFDQMLTIRVQGRFERDLGVKISMDQKESVQETLRPYVEVYNSFHGTKTIPTSKKANDSNAVKEKLKEKTSLFQYDLRTLMLLVLVVASFSSWYGIFYRRMEETASQIARFQKKFEGVECREYGKGIHSLSFTKCTKALSDEDMADLAACPQLECLYFKNDALTDSGMAQLEKLTELRHLSISGDNTTDDELVHLEKLTNLEYLTLSGKNITDAGLKHLKSLKTLKHLSIYGTSITPEGTKEIQKELPETKVF